MDRLIFDNHPDGLALLDGQYRVLDWNGNAENLLGVSREEALGRRIQNLMHLDDSRFGMPELPIQSPRGGILALQEHLGQGLVWLEWMLRPFEDGAVSFRYLFLMRDVSAQKRTRDRLAALLLFQEKMFDNGATWIHTLDRAGRVTFWNRAAESISGYSREEALGSDDLWSRMFPDADYRKQIRAILNDTLQNGRDIEDLETQIITASGKERVLSWHFTPLLADNGQVVGATTIGRDITERKQAEDAIMQNAVRFRELFHNMRNGVLVCEYDPDENTFIIKDLNRSGENIEKVRRAFVINHSVTEALPCFAEGDLMDVLARVYESGQAEHHPVTRTREGTIVTYREYYIYKLPSGELVAIFDDLTEKKRAERELTRHQERLRALTSERVLAEQRERRAIAQDLHDQIGQKLALSKMSLGALLERGVGADVETSLQKVFHTLEDIIREVRSLTFEISSPLLFQEGLDAALRDLAEQTLDPAGIRLEFADLGMRSGLPEDVKILLYQVVRELLHNVLKHSGAAKVELTVLSDDGMVSVMVADDGGGFENEPVASPNPRKRTFGLFSIRERVEYLGGSLEIDTGPGQGTSITVHVPLEKRKETESWQYGS